MKTIVTILALVLAAPAIAQHAAPVPAPAAPAASAAAKFSLDTPIEQIVADPKAKEVLDADLPGLTTHQAYDMFKSMSLNQVAPMSQGKMSAEALAKVQADLSKVN